jgi:glycosyltransferase involved in cell wall biosynthesis
MIVRNEAHIIHELIEAVAPNVDCWVIVDTGPDDGTQKIIRRLMAKRGIPRGSAREILVGLRAQPL